MYARRLQRCLPLLATLALLIATSALAAEPNNTPATATILPGGQLVVSDSLDGSAGRPDTILGLFDLTGLTLLDSDNNSSPLGNNFASQLVGVPMPSSGALFFKVTGWPDSAFAGNHTQNGNYAWYFDVRDPNGQLVPGLSEWQNDDISPGAIDSLWFIKGPSPDVMNPNWEGYTVDMTLNNIVGPGTGDSLDFFTFTGLAPFEEFTATFEGNFAALIALYEGNTRTATSSVFDPVPTLIGTADALGRVKIGVTGAADFDFTGAHVAVGQYTLTLTVVPEPGSVALLGLGLAMMGLWKLKCGRRRSKSIC